VAALDTTLRVIEQEDWRRARVATSAHFLRVRLSALGYNLNDSGSQIIALESGTEQRTIVLRDALESHGIFGSVFCAPATAKNRALIRLSINAALTEDQIERIADACAAIRERVDLQNWPSTRRMQRDTKAAGSLTVVRQAA
jgi:CAI-1 autoinducer synthase